MSAPTSTFGQPKGKHPGGGTAAEASPEVPDPQHVRLAWHAPFDGLRHFEVFRRNGRTTEQERINRPQPQNASQHRRHPHPPIRTAEEVSREYSQAAARQRAYYQKQWDDMVRGLPRAAQAAVINLLDQADDYKDRTGFAPGEEPRKKARKVEDQQPRSALVLENFDSRADDQIGIEKKMRKLFSTAPEQKLHPQPAERQTKAGAEVAPAKRDITGANAEEGAAQKPLNHSERGR